MPCAAIKQKFAAGFDIAFEQVQIIEGALIRSESTPPRVKHAAIN